MSLHSHTCIYTGILTRYILLLNAILMPFERNRLPVSCLSIQRAFFITLQKMVLAECATTTCKIQVYLFETRNKHPMKRQSIALSDRPACAQSQFHFPFLVLETFCFEFLMSGEGKKKTFPENPEMLVRNAFFSCPFSDSNEHAE